MSILNYFNMFKTALPTSVETGLEKATTKELTKAYRMHWRAERSRVRRSHERRAVYSDEDRAIDNYARVVNLSVKLKVMIT